MTKYLKSFFFFSLLIVPAAAQAIGQTSTLPPLSGRQQLTGHVPPALHGKVDLGALDDDERLDVTIGLPLRDPEALRDLLRQIYDPQSPQYRHFLSQEEFVRRFGPSEADHQAVIDFAKSKGLVLTHISPNRALVGLSGSAADIQKVFHVNLRRYRRPDGTVGHAPDREPSVDLDVPLSHIGGLENYYQPHNDLKLHPPLRAGLRPPAAPVHPLPTPLDGSSPYGTYMGNDFRTAYVPGILLQGAGQTIAVIAFSGFRQSDIASYESLGGLPANTPSTFLSGGFNGLPHNDGYEVEIDLDLEMLVSMAPAAQIIVYEVADLDTGFNDIANAPASMLARQISASFINDPGVVDPTIQACLSQFAAQGQSFFEGSGDAGYYKGGAPQYLNDDYVTAVGGTELYTAAGGATYVSESVWTNGGGGPSTETAIPAYQQAVPMLPFNAGGNAGSTIMRNFPDVSMAADGLFVIYKGGTQDWASGTSASTPLWAGFMALVNEQAAANSLPPVGFANPTFYNLGLNQDYLFHDVSDGSTNGYYPAVAGYDLSTGWGSPSACLINALVGLSICPPPTPTSTPSPIPPQSPTFTPIYTPTPNPQTCYVNASSAAATFAGTGTAAYTGDGGPATLAALKGPYGVMVDPGWNLVICDEGNHVVRKVSLDGTITTVAGTGTAGFSGDGGPAILAKMAGPLNTALDSAGNLYITDFANRIRKVAPNGTITTVAGTAGFGYHGDGGLAIYATLNTPWGILLDGSGNILFADSFDYVIRKINPAGIISTFAGTGAGGYSGEGGPATLAHLAQPYAVAEDGSGNFYLSDNGYCVRKIDTNGIITTFAGNGNPGTSGDGGPATLATFGRILGMAFNGGNLYLADYDDGHVRMVDRCGIVSTVFNCPNPTSLTFDPGGNLFVAEASGNLVQELAVNCVPTFTPVCALSAGTPTNTPSPTATGTSTPSPSNTATNSPTLTPTSTASFTPTSTATDSMTATPSLTATASPSPTPSSTATRTPTSTPSSTETPSPTPPSVLSISLPYPNPANGDHVSWSVTVPGSSTVKWKIYTVASREIFGDNLQVSSSDTLVWNLKDRWGTPVANGLYYIKVEINGHQSLTRILKVIVTR